MKKHGKWSPKGSQIREKSGKNDLQKSMRKMMGKGCERASGTSRRGPPGGTTIQEDSSGGNLHK